MNDGMSDGVNGQQIDAIHMGYRQTEGGLHPPIWFSPDSARSAPDQCHS